VCKRETNSIYLALNRCSDLGRFNDIVSAVIDDWFVRWLYAFLSESNPRQHWSDPKHVSRLVYAYNAVSHHTSVGPTDQGFIIANMSEHNYTLQYRPDSYHDRCKRDQLYSHTRKLHSWSFCSPRAGRVGVLRPREYLRHVLPLRNTSWYALDWPARRHAWPPDFIGKFVNKRCFRARVGSCFPDLYDQECDEPPFSLRVTRRSGLVLLHNWLDCRQTG